MAETSIAGPIVLKSGRKQIVFAPVLVPGERDTDGEVLTAEKIGDVALEFMEGFGIVDVMHTLEKVGKPVYSELLRRDEQFTLPDGEIMVCPKGTWIMGAKVNDPDTWSKIEAGTFTGFSVMGVRRADLEAAMKTADPAVGIKAGLARKVLLKDLGEDWVPVAVSILESPAVYKSKWIAVKSKDTLEQKITRILDRLGIKVGKGTEDNNNTDKEVEEMKESEIKELIEKTVKDTVGPAIKEAVKELSSEELTDEEKKAVEEKAATEKAEAEAAEAKAKADAEAAGTKTEEELKVEADAAEAKAKAEAEAGETVEVPKSDFVAMKGALANQEKFNKKVEELLSVQSQGLGASLEATEAAKKSAEKIGPKRDTFGRAVR